MNLETFFEQSIKLMNEYDLKKYTIIDDEVHIRFKGESWIIFQENDMFILLHENKHERNSYHKQLETEWLYYAYRTIQHHGFWFEKRQQEITEIKQKKKTKAYVKGKPMYMKNQRNNKKY